jgi:endoglycosylceramidase
MTNSRKAIRLTLAVGGVAAATLALSAPAVASNAPPAPDRMLSFLHVGPAAGPASVPQVLDERGREVLLRGVNVDGIVDYYRGDLATSYPSDRNAYINGLCPTDDPSVEGVPVCGFDLAQMRPLGYNTIRLNLSWSLLEPQAGVIDSAYIDRIAQVVSWAHAQGVWVVLDMHQDAWSKYVFTPPGQSCPPPLGGIRGYDGAPQWASAHTTPACAINGTRELDPAVQEDFQRLWSDTAGPDGVGLQEHYANVMQQLAVRFAGDPTVAGYEIMNEPSPGYVAPDAMDASELFPFYAKVINTVVGGVPGFRQLFFIEPDVARDLSDQRTVFAPWSTYSAYANVVYAPHVYSGVFTIDAALSKPMPTVFSPSQGYANAVADTRALGLPLWVGEFGCGPNDDNTLLEQYYAQQDVLGLGGALWLWKENANDINSAQSWGVYGGPFGSGTPRPNRVRITSRAYPEMLAGSLLSLAYDDQQASFDIHAASAAVGEGDLNAATLIFVPTAVTGNVVATGADLIVFDRGGGSREVYAFPRGGAYEVSVQPAEPTALPETPWIPALLVAGGAGLPLLSGIRRRRRGPTSAQSLRAGRS